MVYKKSMKDKSSSDMTRCVVHVDRELSQCTTSWSALLKGLDVLFSYSFLIWHLQRGRSLWLLKSLSAFTQVDDEIIIKQTVALTVCSAQHWAPAVLPVTYHLVLTSVHLINIYPWFLPVMSWSMLSDENNAIHRHLALFHWLICQAKSYNHHMVFL